MIFSIKRNAGIATIPEKKQAGTKAKEYTKANVLAAMNQLVDNEYGKKGTALRDQYDAELEKFRK